MNHLCYCVSLTSIYPFPHTTNLQQMTLKTSGHNKKHLYNYKWKHIHLIKLKTLLQKEKSLVLSNFYFCHIDFKSHLLQRRQKSFLCGKGLTRSGSGILNKLYGRVCRRNISSVGILLLRTDLKLNWLSTSDTVVLIITVCTTEVILWNPSAEESLLHY